MAIEITTGVLRRAVRESLSRNALVRSHATADRKNGGDGVTVVELAVLSRRAPMELVAIIVGIGAGAVAIVSGVIAGGRWILSSL